jgi:hypothetical protein
MSWAKVYISAESVLPEICEVIIDGNKTTPLKNEKAAQIAETLLKGFARVGIIALVDEASRC